MSRIEDFGEKIQGARKDAYQRWVDSVEQGAQERADWTQPLSKIWPEPNYERMGVPSAVASWLRSARDDLGPKPARYKMRHWAFKGSMLLRIARTMVNRQWDENTTRDDVNHFVKQCLESPDFESIIEVANPRALGHLFEGIDARARFYDELGHKTSLRLLEFGVGANKKQIKIRESARDRARYYLDDNWDDLIDRVLQEDPFIQSIKAGKPASARKKKGATLAVISNTAEPGIFYIAVKHRTEWVKLARFNRREEAIAAYRDPDLHSQYQQDFEKWKQIPAHRADENKDREGRDWRNGEDVSPEQFMETFGFRGVQFGNYVGNARRQQDLNDTYDAMMDLALALDIAPRSLSLDGTLGLAFGARGRGGRQAPNAHFEPGQAVINLTKSRGAGSLAHEWFHAFDHFVGKHLLQGLTPLRRDSDFVTANLHERTPRIVNYSNVSNHEAMNNAGDAFERIVEMMGARSAELDKRRSQRYWSLPIEIAARSFEAGVKELLSQQGVRNDYLVNIRDESQWQSSSSPINDLVDSMKAPDYPYPAKSELAENASLVLTLVDGLREQIPCLQERFDDQDVEQVGQMALFESQRG